MSPETAVARAASTTNSNQNTASNIEEAGSSLAPATFDEMFAGPGLARPAYAQYLEWFLREEPARLADKAARAEELFRRIGITFNVYDDSAATERLIPFDIVPRLLARDTWAKLSRGIEQRVRAVNSFVADVYGEQEILRAGVVPTDLVLNNEAYLPQMQGLQPPGSIFTHITGVDLVCTGPDEFYVLEDNVRTPSGVSYMLENRETMMQMFPELFSSIRVQPVTDFPHFLRRSLAASAPEGSADRDGWPTIAVLTPGTFNSAYYEHSFLADQMGVELVESRDLQVVDGHLSMRTISGHRPIDVLYRRVDDDFLDPLAFRPDSQLGVAGLMEVYRAGRLTVANAPGTGIADDKALYSYMPEIIEFYTGEPALLNNVTTYRGSEADDLAFMLDHLDELVVKEVHGSGGYGMLVGPASSRAELQRFRHKLMANPGAYIAQPTLALSTVPVLAESGLAPRHVDLRPYVLLSPEGIHITPGGLTRVALTEGSLVVNSSQGGGTKDTWVLE